MTRLRRTLVTLFGFGAAIIFAVIMLIPRPVCGCISPGMRFQWLFGVSAEGQPADVRAAILRRLPPGADASAVVAACAKLNDSVVQSACVLDDRLGCTCSFRTSASLVGWPERSVALQFYVEQGVLADVTVERTSSLF